MTPCLLPPLVNVPAATTEPVPADPGQVYVISAEHGCYFFRRPGDPYLPADVWEVVKQGLEMLPPEGVELLQRACRKLVLNYGPACTDYPPYHAWRGDPGFDAANGLGWPEPCVDLMKSYPRTPDGVARASFDVMNHEFGHAWSEMEAYEGRTKLEDAPEFRRLHAEARWPNELFAENRREAFAGAVEIWGCWRWGRRDRLPSDLDERIPAYLNELAAARGWYKTVPWVSPA